MERRDKKFVANAGAISNMRRRKHGELKKPCHEIKVVACHDMGRENNQRLKIYKNLHTGFLLTFWRLKCS